VRRDVLLGIGWLDNRGIIRGLAELVPADHTSGEVALTVEAEFRRQGIGAMLFTKAQIAARNRGWRHVYLDTAPWNVPMRRIAERWSASYDHEDGIYTMPLKPSDAETVIMGGLDDLLNVGPRLLAA
jgi:GNAT superfamily N-acetyltransferase